MNKTPLHEIHCSAGAKMIEFGGWEMPVQYAGINEEHRAVRSAAGLFDTCHMGEIEISGPKAREFIQTNTPNDLNRIKPGGCLYSALLNERGGVIDDIIIYDLGGDKFMLCVNASNSDKDFAWIESRAVPGVQIENASDKTGMIALQGPNALKIVAKVTDADLAAVKYFHFIVAKVAGVECIASRTGYTGEDGVEFFMNANEAATLWEKIMAAGKDDGLVPVGLGARDTLRLEMGYPLWGHELDEDHTPLESGISWICRWDKGDFVGKEILMQQKKAGWPSEIVGLEMLERGVPRAGYPVFLGDENVGSVTSGTMSPTLSIGVAMARIKRGLAKSEKVLDVIIHGKPRKVKPVGLPFVKRK